MADKYQTQCPHCGVKFQISAQQLQLANGNVRCGSCLQVFQASKNLVPLGGGAAPTAPTAGSARGSARPSAAPSARPSAAPSAAPPAAPPASPAATPPARPTAPPPATKAPPAAARPVTPPAPPAAPVAKPAARPVAPVPPPADAADDDLADMILRELEAPTPPPPPPPKPVAKAPPAAPAPAGEDDLADMILRELEDAPETPATPPTPQPRWDAPAAAGKPAGAPSGTPHWEPPANRYGIEDNKTRIPMKTGRDDGLIDDQLIQDDPSDTFADSRTNNPIVSGDDDIFGGGAATMLDKIDDPVDEDWAKELMGERVEDDKDRLVRQFTEITADSLSLATTGVQKKSGLQERLEGGATPAPLSRTSTASVADDADELDFLSDGALTMQDVELPGIDSDAHQAHIPHQVLWDGQTFWGALCAVFALVFVLQYLVFNFDRLARDESWRGIYAAACSAIGCELPTESDVSRIQGANLVIRSHPKYGGALIVDAIVYNRAPFSQPFPDLELAFSDRAGAPLAGRVFKPSEYLKGELAGAESMPVDTPVHLSLELVDPGENAVNYELRFLPPSSS